MVFEHEKVTGHNKLFLATKQKAVNNDLFEQLLYSGLEGLPQLLSTMINEAMKADSYEG
jgi:hypothetical protein